MTVSQSISRSISSGLSTSIQIGGVLDAVLTPLTSFDMTDATVKFSDDGVTQAVVSDRIARINGSNDYTMVEHDADQGIINGDGFVEGDGATTAMNSPSLVSDAAAGDVLIVMDILSDSNANKVIYTVDNGASETQRYRFYLAGSNLRCDLNNTNTDVATGDLTGVRTRLAFAVVDDLLSVWVDGVLVGEEIPFAISSLTGIVTPRITFFADINGATDERFEYDGKAYRVTVWKVV